MKGWRGAVAMALCACAGIALAGAPGSRGEVVFDQYSPLSSNTEIVRRLLSPLTADQMRAAMARSGQALGAQALDLSTERFLVHAPPGAPPPSGYALMVFVPPWEDARAPEGWAPVLDRHGMIFVSAARSGNDANILGRRVPLALLAVENAKRLYAVDPDRVFVAGFSGGSRVAMRLALGYPDVFRGALLNAGSDPIGELQSPIPPKDLFARFQASSRLVYVTGDQDTINRDKDASSLLSMRRWCVFDVRDQPLFHTGHAPPGPGDLSRALDALLAAARPAAGALEACRTSVEQRLTARLARLSALEAAGKADEASRLLYRIDAEFGGLAAPLASNRR